MTESPEDARRIDIRIDKTDMKDELSDTEENREETGEKEETE